jgi:hypothetical protein
MAKKNNVEEINICPLKSNDEILNIPLVGFRMTNQRIKKDGRLLGLS